MCYNSASQSAAQAPATAVILAVDSRRDAPRSSQPGALAGAAGRQVQVRRFPRILQQASKEEVQKCEKLKKPYAI
jgi:hypothetical protein